MSCNNRTIILLLLACCCIYTTANAEQTTRTPQQTQRQKTYSSWYKANLPVYEQYGDPGIAEALNWQADKNKFCAGSYTQPEIVTAYPNPLPAKQLPVNITSAGPITFLNSGTAKAVRNVIATQPGRIAEADLAYIYYDKNHNIKRIDLLGRARLQLYQQLIAGSEIIWDIKNNTAWSKKSVYKKKSGMFNTWGTARAIQTLPHKITNLWDASYTTCNPKNPTWRISAAHIHLNNNTGMGSASAAVVYFKKMPVMFFPYYRFPIDKKRHTGFLAPSFAYSNQYGANLIWPYYWNIAPNFDSTITPAWYGKNGFKLDNNFRYLTYNSVGNFYFGFLPYDLNAAKFSNYLNTTFPNAITGNSKIPRQRWALSTDNKITFNDQWNARIRASRVSDDYYLQDFSVLSSGALDNTLPEDADLYYNSSQWHWHGAVNYTQNLYPANSSSFGSVNYARLPEIEGRTDYPYAWHNLGFSADWQAVYFQQISKYPLMTNPYLSATGGRWHARPGISLPINFASATIDPQILWDATAYTLKSNPNFANSTRSLPIVDVNNSAYFAASWHLASWHFLQTFEPDVFYLYIPYKNQDNIPNFDSYSNPFGYGNLISLNSYTGYDRIQNANQLSVGITSRTFDADSGAERTELGLGFVRYFATRKVGLDPTYTPDDTKYSPLAAEFTAYITPHLSATASGAWRLVRPPGQLTAANKTGLSNASANINYNNGYNDIFSATYSYIPNGTYDTETSQYQNYQNLKIGASINISDHWSAVGYWDHNLQRKLNNGYLGGLTYNSCCWAFSTLYSSTLISDTAAIQKYQHRVYLQFVFKGLGGVGTDVEKEVSPYIPGFTNQFSKGQIQ